MKILAFSDIHGDINYLKEVYRKSKRENIDLIIFAGDLFEFYKYSKRVKEILNEFDKKILLIHGNHENQELINKVCSDNIINIHNKIIEINKIKFFGYGGGGFSYQDKRLEFAVEKIKNELNNWVFVTHQPPFNTNLDKIRNDHVGSKSIKKIIEIFNPLLNICGHLHENFNVEDKIKRTKIINPGPSGRVVNI
jgi:Icc-related predicted phosphoesterase